MRSAAASACRSASKKLSVDALSPPSLPRRLRGDTNAGTSTGCSGGHDGTVDAMDGRTDGWIEGGFVEAAVGLCRTKNRTVRTQHSHAHSQHSAEYMHTAGQRQNAANTHTHTQSHTKRNTLTSLQTATVVLAVIRTAAARSLWATKQLNFNTNRGKCTGKGRKPRESVSKQGECTAGSSSKRRTAEVRSPRRQVAHRPDTEFAACAICGCVHCLLRVKTHPH